MKKSSFISLIALCTALAGLLVALAAYFGKKHCVVCDDIDDDLLYEEPDDSEYYSAHIDECDDDCDCCDCCDDAIDEAAEQPSDELAEDKD